MQLTTPLPALRRGLLVGIEAAAIALRLGHLILPGSHLREAELALGGAFDCLGRGQIAAAEQDLHDAHVAAGLVLAAGDPLLIAIGNLWQVACRLRDALLVADAPAAASAPC